MNIADLVYNKRTTKTTDKTKFISICKTDSHLWPAAILTQSELPMHEV